MRLDSTTEISTVGLLGEILQFEFLQFGENGRFVK